MASSPLPDDYAPSESSWRTDDEDTSWNTDFDDTNVFSSSPVGSGSSGSSVSSDELAGVHISYVPEWLEPEATRASPIGRHPAVLPGDRLQNPTEYAK